MVWFWNIVLTVMKTFCLFWWLGEENIKSCWVVCHVFQSDAISLVPGHQSGQYDKSITSLVWPQGNYEYYAMRSNVQCSINEANFSLATHSLSLMHFLVEGAWGFIVGGWQRRSTAVCVYSTERLCMNFKPMALQLRLNDWVCLEKDQNVYKHVSVIAWFRLSWIISVYLKAQRVRWNRSTKLEVTRQETWLNWWEWVGK